MDLKLAGKIALVTGSSRGIGLASARAFAAEGCRLMLSTRSAEPLAHAANELRATGAEVAAYAADVGTPQGAAALIDAAVSTCWSTMSVAEAAARGSPTAPTMIGAARSSAT
jgi:3-oxoacyl-[acyl-carrier protein] reductase